MGTRKTRIECIENKVGNFNNYFTFKKMRRHSYNVRFVSDAALIASFRRSIGEIEMPQWAEDEFQKKIPFDANKKSIEKAEWEAQEIIEESGKEITDSEVDKLILEAISFYVDDLKFKNLKEAQWVFHQALILNIQFHNIKDKLDSGKLMIPEDYQ